MIPTSGALAGGLKWVGDTHVVDVHLSNLRRTDLLCTVTEDQDGRALVSA
jgi:hypothetical protein